MPRQARGHLGLRTTGHLINRDGAAAVQVLGLAQQAVAPAHGGKSALGAAVETDFVGSAGGHVHHVLWQRLRLLHDQRKAAGAEVAGLRAHRRRAGPGELGRDDRASNVERPGAKRRASHAARKTGVVKNQHLVGALGQGRQALAHFHVGQHLAVGGQQALGAAIFFDPFVKGAGAVARVVDKDPVAVGHPGVQGGDLGADPVGRGVLVAQHADVARRYGHGGGHALSADHVVRNAFERWHGRVQVFANADDQRMTGVAHWRCGLRLGGCCQQAAAGQEQNRQHVFPRPECGFAALGQEHRHALHSSVTTRTRRLSADPGSRALARSLEPLPTARRRAGCTPNATR